MSDTDSLDYLQSGFDPSSLTVPRLRSILVSHSIAYPSGAKKPQLIEIFTDNVLPHSRKILAARARARRTSKGITDADSQDSTIADEELMPPPPTPRSTRRKASSKVKSEESESDVSSNIRSPTKRTPRASNKHARASDTETGTDLEMKKSVRKARKSEAPTPVPPQIPRFEEEDIDDGAGVSRRESAFTYDNPFQSGSSPPAETRTPSGERLRKSLSAKDSAWRKSSSTRRRTDSPQVDDGIHPPTSATFEVPVSQITRYKDSDGAVAQSIEPSEEFTPEEQLELVRERAANGVRTLPPRLRRTQPPSRIAKGPIYLILFALLGGYAAWYRQEKVKVGFCGVGRAATPLIPALEGVELPEWAKLFIEPECELCPQHAYCYKDLVVECEHDFVLKQHPLALGGVVPLTPTCEPDGEKVRKVKAVADRAVEILRERRAEFECGELVDEAGVPEPQVEIDAEALKKEVSKKRRKGMGEAEFEELWAGAIGEIEGREEVESKVDG